MKIEGWLLCPFMAESQIRKRSRTKDLCYPKSQRFYAFMLPAVRPFAKGEAEPRLFVTPSNKIAIRKKKRKKERQKREDGRKSRRCGSSVGISRHPHQCCNCKSEAQSIAKRTKRRSDKQNGERIAEQSVNPGKRKKNKVRQKIVNEMAYGIERQVMCTTTC